MASYSPNFWKLLAGLVLVLVLAWLADLNTTLGDIAVAIIILAYILLLLNHPQVPQTIANLLAKG
jgi:hypothetical protein